MTDLPAPDGMMTAQEAAWDYVKKGVWYDWLDHVTPQYAKNFWMWVDAYV
jgi:hypothetical protein